MTKKATLPFLILLVLLCSCNKTSDPCSPEIVSQYVEVLDTQAKNFEDLASKAGAVPAESLEPIIKEMQAVQQEVADTDAIPCGIEVKAALESYVDTTIQGYFRIHVQALSITPESDGPDIEDYVTLAASKLDYYKTIREEFVEAYLPDSGG